MSTTLPRRERVSIDLENGLSVEIVIGISYSGPNVPRPIPKFIARTIVGGDGAKGEPSVELEFETTFTERPV